MQILEILFLVMTSSGRHEYSYDTHHVVVFNRAKFDARTYSSLRGVKTDRHIDRIALYILNQWFPKFTSDKLLFKT